MRGAFVDALMELAAADSRVFLMTADLGFSVLEKFALRFPNQFVNVGVAEANMLSMAAGMAREGYVPYVYSIATFSSMRGYEQARNGAVIHHLPVRIIGIGGGFAYGHAGITHFALEDYAIMRVQPGMRVVAPVDPAQTRAAVVENHRYDGPVYFRIGKGNNAPVPGLEGRYSVDDIVTLGEGRDFLLLTTGSITHEALEAQKLLAASGLHGTVGVVATLNPAPRAALERLRGKYARVVVLEEHYLHGGLGSVVAELLAELGWAVPFKRVAVRELPLGELGSPAFMYEKMGISRRHAADAVRALEPLK